MNFVKSLFKLLSVKHKRRYTYLQLLFLVTALVQVAGIASLAPFIALLSNPDIIVTNPIISAIYKHFNFASQESFLTAFAIMIMGTIATSNAIAAYSTWKLFGFSVDVGADLQNRVYGNYINNDYVFFSKNNSSRLIAIITQEIPRFIYMVLQPFLNLTSQLLVASIIMIGLIYIDYILALFFIVVTGGIYFLIFKLLRERLVSHGSLLTKINREILKLLNESLGGIKEVKLLGTEMWYQEQVVQNNRKGLRSSAFIGLSGDLPRFIVETATFLAILGMALYLMEKYGGSGNVISILSLYAMAGYKLLPAVQTLYKSFSLIKANGGIVPELLEEIDSSTPQSIGRHQGVPIHIKEPRIQLNNVSYRYPGANNEALRDLSLTIMPNTTVAFVGASGAGKSTAVDIILGLLYPDEGQLVVGGEVITRNNSKSWQKHIGYVPQSIFIVDDTITSNIAFGVPKEEIDIDRVVTAAKIANIHEFISTLPEQYNFIVGEGGAQLSGGQKQRIGIARALYHDTNVLILDEATSALDSITESQIMSEIFSLNKLRTIIIIAHRLSTIVNADNIVFFENGTVSDQGTFQELRHRNSNFDMLVKRGGLP